MLKIGLFRLWRLEKIARTFPCFWTEMPACVPFVVLPITEEPFPATVMTYTESTHSNLVLKAFEIMLCVSFPVFDKRSNLGNNKRNRELLLLQTLYFFFAFSLRYRYMLVCFCRIFFHQCAWLQLELSNTCQLYSALLFSCLKKGHHRLSLKFGNDKIHCQAALISHTKAISSFWSKLAVIL